MLVEYVVGAECNDDLIVANSTCEDTWGLWWNILGATMPIFQCTRSTGTHQQTALAL